MAVTALAEYRARLRCDLYGFTQHCFYELNPQSEFAGNWHIEAIMGKLEAVRLGKIRRLIINLPPRHLKSLCASIALPAWLLGHDPAAQIMCVSYGQDLADKLARDCRTVMSASWYQDLFPTRLSSSKQAVQEYVTTAQGYRLSTSVGGALTGRGADVIIIDDPMKPDEAASESQRRAVNQWYDHTLYSRLNDKERGAIILIMQRLHEDDLTGHVLAQEPWEVLTLPAIAEEDELHTFATPFGQRSVKRGKGEALHPERESRETLERIRKTLGTYHFAAQYQQEPVPFGGAMVMRHWFQTYPAEDPPRVETILQSWDTANKATELSDYSVCTTWGIKERRLYLLDVLRQRLDYPELKRAVHRAWQEWEPDTVVIEDKASGTQLIQELKAEGVANIAPYVPEQDKLMRLYAQTATIENGFVYVPSEAPWLDDYLRELMAFPNGKHSDQVDSTSQALAWLNRPKPVTFSFA